MEGLVLPQVQGAEVVLQLIFLGAAEVAGHQHRQEEVEVEERKVQSAQVVVEEAIQEHQSFLQVGAAGEVRQARKLEVEGAAAIEGRSEQEVEVGVLLVVRDPSLVI
jgi:hypothetical protein